MEGPSYSQFQSTLNKANAMVEEIIRKIRPTNEGVIQREEVLTCVRRHVQSIDSAFDVIAYGSMPLRTFLPESDVDLVIIGPPTPLQDIKHVLEKNPQFRNVITLGTGTDAEILRFFVGSMQVDLCINHDDGLASNLFMEMVNRIFMRNNLFKESILLVKAWSTIEAKISGQGLLTSYAIQVMVMHVLLHLPGKSVTPFEVFKRFLETYSQFDWDKLAMGRRGVIKIYELNDLQTAYKGNPEFDLLAPCLEYCASETNSGKPPVSKKDGYVKAEMNIVDPMNRFKNVAYKVKQPNKRRHIIDQLKRGHKDVKELLLASTEEELRGKLHNFFKNINKKRIRTESFSRLTTDDLSDKVQEYVEVRRMLHPKFRALPFAIPPIPPAEPPPPMPL